MNEMEEETRSEIVENLNEIKERIARIEEAIGAMSDEEGSGVVSGWERTCRILASIFIEDPENNIVTRTRFGEICNENNISHQGGAGLYAWGTNMTKIGDGNKSALKEHGRQKAIEYLRTKRGREWLRQQYSDKADEIEGML